MGNCLYSSYKVPEGDFKLQQEQISYSGGKIRGSENIYWQSKVLKLDHIHVEAHRDMVITASEVHCSFATIKAADIYVAKGVDFSGCKFIGQVHVDTLDNLNDMI